MKALHMASTVWRKVFEEKTAGMEGPVLQGNLRRTRVKVFVFQ